MLKAKQIRRVLLTLSDVCVSRSGVGNTIHFLAPKDQTSVKQIYIICLLVLALQYHS